ncbi:MAG: S24 family peptidase [Candidatus Hadarchaeales archaeon]
MSYPKLVAISILLLFSLLLLLTIPPPYPRDTKDWSEAFLGHRALLDRRIWPLTLMGSSMYPSLTENDLLLCVEEDPANLRIGDIVVYRYEGTLVAHRIVGFWENGVVTKGDAPEAWEEHRVGWEDIRGRVMGVLPR